MKRADSSASKGENENPGGGRTFSLSFQLAAALTVALFPIAIAAALVENSNLRMSRAAEMHAAESKFREARTAIDDMVEMRFAVLRTMLQRPAYTPAERAACDLALARTVEAEAMFDAIVKLSADGRRVCGSPGNSLPDVRGARAGRSLRWDGGEHVTFIVSGDGEPPDGHSIAASAPAAALRERIGAITLAEGDRLAVWIGERRLAGSTLAIPDAALATPATRRLDAKAGRPAAIMVSGPLGAEGLRLGLQTAVPPLGIAGAASMLLPAAMWLAALLISWLLIRRLVVKPLQAMARGVVDYGAGDDMIRLSARAGSADELRTFAAFFDQMADDAVEARSEIAEALTAQRRLMREVHHRVKNNLQIIASLLSIHSREAEGEIARCYAAIQMRVNALALVHRWLFEDSGSGVDLAALTHDLCGSLQHSLNATYRVEVAMNARIERLYVTQDAAVPIAFLITEVVAAAGRIAEAAGRRTPLPFAITLASDDGRGRLSLAADVFAGADELGSASRVAAARIVHGMVRQLRGSIEFCSASGTYAVTFPLHRPN